MGLAPGALGLDRAAAGGEVQVLDVHAEDLLRAGAGLVEHPPQRLLPQVDLTAGDEPVHGHLRAGRGLGVRHGQPLRPGRDRRTVVAVLRAPAQPGQHRRPAGVPGVDRRRAPQQFQGLADLVVRDRPERAGLPDPLGGLADPDTVAADGVRVAERVEEGVGRRPDGQRLPGRQSHDGGHRFPLATDNRAASRTARRTSPQVTNQAPADNRALSVEQLHTRPATNTPPTAHQGRRTLCAGFRSDVPRPPDQRHPGRAGRPGAGPRLAQGTRRRRRPGHRGRPGRPGHGHAVRGAVREDHAATRTPTASWPRSATTSSTTPTRSTPR